MCTDNLAVTYSPLCDTDKTVYREYLQAVRDVRYLESKDVEYVRDLFRDGGCRIFDLCGKDGLLFRDGEAVGIGRVVDRLRLRGSSDSQGQDVGGEDGVEDGRFERIARDCEFGRGADRGARCGGERVAGFCDKAQVEQGDGGESAGPGGESGEFFVESSGVPKGKNWKRNQRRKMNRRGQINVDTGSELGSSDSVRGTEINVDTGSRDVGQNVVRSSKDALRLSLEEKWRAENELKVAKARRELELLKAEDLDAVKKLRERKVQGATERTMVQIEKAHASLVQTGNVPGVQPVQQGFCQTVVDGEIVESVPGLSGGESKGCSISPSSSISEREVRQMKKENEDQKAKIVMLERKMKRMGLAYDVLRGKEHVAVSVVAGSVPESARQALDDVCGKGDWEAIGDLDMDPDTLYLQMDYSNKFDYGGCY